MPRRSVRKKTLDEFNYHLQLDIVNSLFHHILADDSDEDPESDGDEDVLLSCSLKVASSVVLDNSRYLFRSDRYRPNVRSKDLPVGHVPIWQKVVDGELYNEAEFLKFFRAPRLLFLELVDLVKDHSAFQFDGKKHRRHLSPYLHMLVTLKYFGGMGNGCSAHTVKDGLGISVGSVHSYVDRCVKVILSLENQTLFWPDVRERVELKSRIKEKFYFPNCVGMVDGTHLGLMEKPSEHGEDYFTRKCEYGVVAMVVCDDKRRIRYLNVGWPASVHDQRVWRNTMVSNKPDNFFSSGEYLVADSAFSNTTFIVPAYKKFADGGEGKVEFNTLLGTVRVLSEHTIGIWKGRFPWLRSIPIKVSNKSSMLRLVRYVRATAILHNLLVRHEPPREWILPEEPNDFLDDQFQARDLTPEQGERGGRRREIHNYFRELQLCP